MYGFFFIVEDVLISIFSGWCQGTDFVQLDSALCNKGHRDKFWSLMTDQRMLSVELNTFTKKQKFEWFYKRNVRFKNVCLSGKFSDTLALKDIPVNTYCNIVTLTLCSLKQNYDPDQMSDFLNSCPNLLHLRVSYCVGMDKLLCRVKSCVWQSLTELSLFFSLSINRLLERISIYCRRLVLLRVSSRSFTEDRVKQIILSNPLITKLSIRGCDKVTLQFTNVLMPSLMKNILDLDIYIVCYIQLQSLFPLLHSISIMTNTFSILIRQNNSANFWITYYKDLTEDIIRDKFFNNILQVPTIWPVVDLDAADQTDYRYFDPGGPEREKLMVQHIHTLNLVGKSAMYLKGDMNELMQRHKVVPFRFFENLALVQFEEVVISDELLTCMHKGMPSLEVLCIDIQNLTAGDEQPTIMVSDEVVEHPNYLVTEPLSSELKQFSCRMLTNINDAVEAPQVNLVIL
jgi:hypothetical protein